MAAAQWNDQQPPVVLHIYRSCFVRCTASSSTRHAAAWAPFAAVILVVLGLTLPPLISAQGVRRVRRRGFRAILDIKPFSLVTQDWGDIFSYCHATPSLRLKSLHGTMQSAVLSTCVDPELNEIGRQQAVVLSENLEQWPRLNELVQCYKVDFVKDDGKYGHYESVAPPSFQNHIFKGPDTDMETEPQLRNARHSKPKESNEDDMPSTSTPPKPTRSASRPTSLSLTHTHLRLTLLPLGLSPLSSKTRLFFPLKAKPCAILHVSPSRTWSSVCVTLPVRIHDVDVMLFTLSMAEWIRPPRYGRLRGA